MYLRGFEADAEGGQHENGDEEDLPRVTLQEAPEHEQLLLQPRSYPQRRSPALDVTLWQTTDYVTLCHVTLKQTTLPWVRLLHAFVKSRHVAVCQVMIHIPTLIVYCKYIKPSLSQLL